MSTITYKLCNGCHRRYAVGFARCPWCGVVEYSLPGTGGDAKHDAPTLETMTREMLAMLGADGLVNPEAECGCSISELFICEYPNERECCAAVRVDNGTPCERCGEPITWDIDEGDYKMFAQGWPILCEKCAEES